MLSSSCRENRQASSKTKWTLVSKETSNRIKCRIWVKLSKELSMKEYSSTKLVKVASQVQPNSLSTTKWEVSLTTKTLAWTWWCQVSRCIPNHTPTTLDMTSKTINNLDSHSLTEACTRDSTVLTVVKAIRMQPIRNFKPLSTITNSMFPTMLRDSNNSYSSNNLPSGWTIKTTALM